MPDEFFDARNFLIVGSYNQAIASACTANTGSLKGEDLANFNADKDAIMARAQLGLGQSDAVMAHIRTATHPYLLSVKLWADYVVAKQRKSGPAAINAALDAMVRVVMEGSVEERNIYTAIFAASGLLEQGKVAESLTLCKKWLAALPEPVQYRTYFHLELRSLVVEGLLRLHRIDLAKNEAEKMEKTDEESVLTILSLGVVALALGQSDGRADHYETALASFKDVSMRCGQSSLTLNLTALAYMGLHRTEDAQKTLLDALAVRSGDSDTTANLSAVMAHAGKPQQEQKTYLSQATELPGAWAVAYKEAATDLDNAIAKFRAA